MGKEEMLVGAKETGPSSRPMVMACGSQTAAGDSFIRARGRGNIPAGEGWNHGFC